MNGLNLDQFLSWIIGSAGLPDPILELIQILNGNLRVTTGEPEPEPTGAPRS